MRYLSISDRNRTSGSSTCKVLHQPVSTFVWLFQALPCVGFLSLRTVLHCPGKGGDCTCEGCLQAAIGMSSFVLGRISLSKWKSVVMYGVNVTRKHPNVRGFRPDPGRDSRWAA